VHPAGATGGGLKRKYEVEGGPVVWSNGPPGEMMTDDDEWTSEPTAMHRVALSVRGENEPDLLEQRTGPGSPRRIPLVQDQVLVGRIDGVDLRIPSSSVSRQHARIERSGPELTITDLDSQNGVLINGTRVHSAVLRDRDQVQLGDAVFIFRRGST
jgi:pSer/pThr/pTyr-binding forkhead associated (FHA) protein